uniref:Uncharacterized protein n=1 Tax=Picea glauca TaxID=3330 RepID=A0A101M188_PICGL|nr:hypothetical protein ABT39_MTgene4399 [Picea glauca]
MCDDTTRVRMHRLIALLLPKLVSALCLTLPLVELG